MPVIPLVLLNSLRHLPFSGRRAPAFPSLVVAASRTEGFGLTPMEAMASGAPVVTSGAGFWPELIKPGVNGTQFATGDVEDLKKVLRPLLAEPKSLTDLGFHLSFDRGFLLLDPIVTGF